MKRYIILLAGLTVILGGAAGWWLFSPEPQLRVVNVLDKALYEDAHIAGSIHVPLTQVKEYAQKWNRSVPVVFYCSNYYCTSSFQAAKWLQEMGFEEVYVYEGGMAEWYTLSQQDPSYEVVGPAQDRYLTIEVSDPGREPEGVRVLTAQELQKIMKEANLISR